MSVIGRERLVQQLRGYNPWWSGVPRPLPEFRRVAFHRCLRRLDRPDLRRAILLSGPRRVGKSTILLQIVRALIDQGADPRSILYATLDDNILKLAGIQEILSAYREVVWAHPAPACILFDEIHYAPAWDIELKRLVDHEPQYRILATGSASLETRERIAHSGVGRWITETIPTLSFYEYLHLIDQAPAGVNHSLRPSSLLNAPEHELHALAEALAPALPAFRRYLLTGGFPETARLNDVSECQRLLREDIVDRVLKRDMVTLFHIRNLTDLERLFLYVCLHSGKQINVSRCSEQLGTSRTTVGNHLEWLRAANLLYRVDPYRSGGKKPLKAQSKYYLVDAALRNAILLSGEAILEDPQELGLVVETAVLRHLHAFYYSDSPRISYWLDQASGDEVDIVIHSPRYTIAVEVKYRSEARLGRGLLKFCSAERPTRAFLITRHAEHFGPLHRDEGAILRIPAHIFTYLLGQAEQRRAEDRSDDAQDA